MKKLWVVQIVVVLAIAGLYFLQAKQATKIAVVDNVKLISNYKGVQSLMKDLENKKKEWLARVDTLTLELQEEMKAYEKDRHTFSPAQQKEREQQMEKKRRQLYEYQQTMEGKHQQEKEKLSREALTPLDAFVKDYAKKNGYNVVLGASNMGNILYADEVIDITDKVLEEINKTYVE